MDDSFFSIIVKILKKQMGAQESTKQDFLPGKQKNKDIFPLAHIIVHFDHVYVKN